MKKTYLAMALAMSVGVVSAQDAAESSTESSTSSVELMKSKNGQVIPAEAGEWSLGIEATANISSFFGQNAAGTFGAANIPSPVSTFSPNRPQVIVSVKKMLDESTAARVRFGLDLWRNADKAPVMASAIIPRNQYATFLDDWEIRRNTSLYLSAGIEKRRGKGRLFGIYGGELVGGLSRGSLTYQYGNAISNDYKTVSTHITNTTFPTTPTFGVAYTHNFSNNVISFNSSGFEYGARMKEQTGGTAYMIGLRGFVGVEYFIFPKISLGGEFGYMLNYQTTSVINQTYEFWNPDINGVGEYKRDVKGNYGSRWAAGFENLNGRINLNFYF